MTGMRHVGCLWAAFACTLAGCPECVHAQLAQDIARLSIENLDAILALVETDAVCGFSSEGARVNDRLEGRVGAEGALMSTVEDCAIDLGEEGRRLPEDCLGDAPTLRGKVTVRARRTLVGTVSGHPSHPIIPSSPEALQVELESVRFDNFQLSWDDREDSFVIRRGAISALAEPLLGVAADSGACLIPTPNVSFRHVAYDHAQLVLGRGEDPLEVEVTGSDFAAQRGRRGSVENQMAGTMNIYGEDIDIAGETTLEQDYERIAFLDRYRCAESLATPISFQCTEFAHRHRDDAARLGVGLLAALAAIADQEPSCGFASAVVNDAAQLEQGPQTEMGAVSWTMAPCLLDFEEPFFLPADCDGVRRAVQGRVVLEGRKTVRGRLSGVSTEPIVTNEPDALLITLHASLDGLHAFDLREGAGIVVSRGELEGSIQPMLYADGRSGACTVASPNAEFTDVQWDNAEMVLETAAGAFPIHVEAARIDATAGTTASGTNRLRGVIRVGGRETPVGADGAGLEPGFERAEFGRSWQCDPALAQPPTMECGQRARGP